MRSYILVTKNPNKLIMGISGGHVPLVPPPFPTPLSVTLVHCIQTAEDIVTFLCGPGSPIILVFDLQR